jgi:hypothetical protein
MRFITNKIQLLSIFTLAIILQSFSGCTGGDPEPDKVIKEPISIQFKHFYNGTPLEFNKLYKSPQKNDLWFVKKKYYLSNIVGVKSDGNKELIADVALIDASMSSADNLITGNIVRGDYTAIMFDLGVRQDLNAMDPATFSASHPLSVTHNMYWGWSTQYIFSKIEGFEISNYDTASFVIHTGTQDLYRPEVLVPRSFTLAAGGSQISINLDLYHLLKQNEYTFNLIQDGQSHTADNKPLAIQYMDNFKNAFN